MHICPNCQSTNKGTARFCQRCGWLLSAPAAGTGRLVAGTVLNQRYTIVGTLGRGGMAAVYAAGDLRLPAARWAVKEMSDALIADPAERQQAVANFRREAQLLASLSHPNLPRVIDYFEQGGKQYLVMEHVDGQTLEQVAHSSPGMLDEARVLGWIDQVCGVLGYLHAQQPPIVFRDLKPGNIMLDRQGQIKLIDFGIARLFKPGQTRDTAPMGTPGYAAPEAHGKAQTDARSDVYSLGATLHALLTRYDPSQTPFVLPAPHSLNPGLSPRVVAVISRALQMDPALRFQSVAELRQALLQPATPGPWAVPPALPAAGLAPTAPVSPPGGLPPVTPASPPGGLPQTTPASPPGGLAPTAPVSPPAGLPAAWAVPPAAVPPAPYQPPPGSYAPPPGPMRPPPPQSMVAGRGSGSGTRPGRLVPLLLGALVLVGLVAVVLGATGAFRRDEPAATPPRRTVATLFAPTPTATGGAGVGTAASPTPPPGLATPTSVLLTATPKPPPTRAPTLTPPPATATRTPKPPTATPTPAPACPSPPQGEFARLWQAYAGRLGCPLQALPAVVQDAEQQFQNGHMFWRADKNYAYVVYEQGPQAGTFQGRSDPWREGNPEYSCTASPPPGLIQPKRGFGYAWCQLGAANAPIGWALGEEAGFSSGNGNPMAQDFQNGTIFRDSDGTARGMAYVFFGDGTFLHTRY
jgi:serine/threonine-protein kinase